MKGLRWSEADDIIPEKKHKWIEVEFFKFIVSFEKENKRTPKVFISGAITNRIDTYRQYFEDAEEYMDEIGLEYYSPTKLPSDTSWEESIEITLNELKDCDCVYVLKNWEESKGVKLEMEKAKELDIPVFFQ